eukprot:TRINITY_DN2694_c0_g1_i1.p1 TRINITY_DN2694_c0_g1~~TRINITY_DN2694_c0_g1_i1.p1  ORF type:complete len:121 (-),score=12.63 TRINITY_DN2694_c0_g1_i1:105-467(-)
MPRGQQIGMGICSPGLEFAPGVRFDDNCCGAYLDARQFHTFTSGRETAYKFDSRASRSLQRGRETNASAFTMKYDKNAHEVIYTLPHGGASYGFLIPEKFHTQDVHAVFMVWNSCSFTLI